MTGTTMTRRALLASLATAGCLGLAILPGCGEPEADIAPAEKPKDELQKDIENPYGAAPIEGKARRPR
jgi:hypothetical protein